MSTLNAFIQDCCEQVNQQLDNSLPTAGGPASHLFEAMRYSTFNGGKRIRPVLCFAAATAITEPDDNVAKVAAAVEMIHAYSLIHDDLPSMDNDNLRRGKPTCHIAFDEATAILAGDGLQALAFQQLTELEGVPSSIIVELVSILSRFGGCSGMVAGQAIDLAATGQTLSLNELKNMHAHKTGALIKASVMMGALVTNMSSQEQLEALTQYASAIGLAFQIQDDILDVQCPTEQLGKQQGSDLANGKATYTSILGLEKARQKTSNLLSESLDALSSFDVRADRLREIAHFIVQRQH